MRFISVNDGFDSDRQECSAGDVGVAFKSLCNDYYSKDLSRKIRAGVNTLRQTGKYLSPYAVYGYKKSAYDQYRLEIDEPAAAQVRRIFEMRFNGEQLGGIAKALNIDSIPTPMVYKRENGVKRGWNTHSGNNVWNDTIIRDILRDIRYIGAVVQGKNKCDVVGSGKSRALPMEQWHITYDQHEPIISKEVFDAVQSPGKRRKPPSNTNRNPLSGKVRCGGCGYSLARSSAKTPLYYCKQRLFTDSDTCFSERINPSVVENVLISAIQKLLEIFAEEEERRKVYADKFAASSAGLLKELGVLQRKMTVLQNEKLTLYTRYSDGVLAKSEYIALRDEADNSIAVLSEQSAALERRRAESVETPSNPVFEAVTDLRFDGNLTHEIIDALVDKIIVHSTNRIEIKWKFSDSDFADAIS